MQAAGGAAPARGVVHLLPRRDFRRLLATRLLGQFGDGVFQAALAGTVLFNPQRAAEPIDVAAGFAILLLPYSFVGPFAGVWLDRWSRRQVLLLANVLRAGLVVVVAALVLAGVQGTGFYLAGLAVFSVNRFVLSALSASLPHTVDAASLVSANALSTTAGSMSTVAGGGAALGLLQVVGATDGGYAVLALGAALPHLAAAAVAAGFGRGQLGPDAAAAVVTAGDVVRGMADGARHAWAHPPAAAVLVAISLHRIWYGLLTLMTLLLYRNTFDSAGSFFRGGLLGLGEVIAAAAVGTVLAAVLTPRLVRRFGTVRWVTGVLAGSGVVQLALGLPFVPPTIVAAALALGFAAQSVKICVDTTLQESVDDDFRGRVFSVYDTLFNVTFVGALVVGALTLPPSGVSPGMLAVVATGYLITAATYARITAGH